MSVQHVYNVHLENNQSKGHTGQIQTYSRAFSTLRTTPGPDAAPKPSLDLEDFKPLATCKPESKEAAFNLMGDSSGDSSQDAAGMLGTYKN